MTQPISSDLLIVVAEKEELKLIPDLPTDIEVLITGVGAINIINALRDVPRSKHLINIGYAGSANFDVGTWVEVTQAKLNHPNVDYPEPQLPLDELIEPFKQKATIKAPCFTGVDFVLQSKEKDCVFDMELAFIAALGFNKLSSLKYVSDNLSLHQYREVGAGV